MFNYIFALNMYLKQRKHKKSLVSQKYIEGTVQLITTTQWLRTFTSFVYQYVVCGILFNFFFNSLYM